MTTDEPISLRHYVERIIDERDRQYMLAIANLEKTATKVEAAQHDYNKAHNDLQRKMEDQAKGFISREEAQNLSAINAEKIESIRVLLTQAAAALEKEVAELRAAAAQHSGKGQGIHQGWVYLIGFVGLLGGLAGVVSIVIEVMTRKL